MRQIIPFREPLDVTLSIDANTASEARAIAKRRIGCDRLPQGTRVRWVKPLRERARDQRR